MSANEKIEFSDKLKEARIRNNRTQVECARKCGVCLESYQKWERGVSYPREENLKTIKDFLEIE